MNFESRRSPAELYQQAKEAKKEANKEEVKEVDEEEKKEPVKILMDNEEILEQVGKKSQQLAEEYPEEYARYLEVLRKSRKAGGDSHQDFLKAELYCKAIYNLVRANKDRNPKTSKMFEHQVDMSEDIIKWLDAGEHSGYVEAATSTGKTVVFVEFISALIGKQPEEPKEKLAASGLRTLVLVPSKDLVNQVVGDPSSPEDTKKKGFAGFGSPNLNVTKYYGDEKNLSGDVVVMTYQSMSAIIKGYEDDGKEEYKEAYIMLKGFTDPHHPENNIPPAFSAVVCDEAHEALGDVRQPDLISICPDAIKIGFTATPFFNKSGKTISSIFGEKFHKLSIEDAVEKNIVSDPRSYVIKSKLKVDMVISEGDYSPESLALLDDPERNNIAIGIAVDCIAKGKQGLISCVPKVEDGRSCAHAWKIAEELSKRTYIDPETGEEKKIDARAIDSSMDTKDKEDIYKLFTEGKVQFLTFVDALKQGWDNDKASVLINLRPTLSLVLALQRLGRILRKEDYGQHEYCDVYDIIDELFSSRNWSGETQLLAAELLGMKNGDTLITGQAQDGSVSDMMYAGIPTKLEINRLPQQIEGVENKGFAINMDGDPVVEGNAASKHLSITPDKLMNMYQGTEQCGKEFYVIAHLIEAIRHNIKEAVMEEKIYVQKFLEFNGLDKDEFLKKFKQKSPTYRELPQVWNLRKLVAIAGISEDEAYEKLREHEYLGTTFLETLSDQTGVSLPILKKLVVENKIEPAGISERTKPNGKKVETPLYDSFNVISKVDDQILKPVERKGQRMA